MSGAQRKDIDHNVNAIRKVIQADNDTPADHRNVIESAVVLLGQALIDLNRLADAVEVIAQQHVTKPRSGVV